jgi:hypothetical protein
MGLAGASSGASSARKNTSRAAFWGVLRRGRSAACAKVSQRGVSDCAKAFKPTAASTAKTAVTRRRERAMGRAGSSIMGLTFLRPEPTGPVLRAQFSPLMQQKLIRIVKVLSACEAAAQPVGGRPGGRLCTSLGGGQGPVLGHHPGAGRPDRRSGPADGRDQAGQLGHRVDFWAILRVCVRSTVVVLQRHFEARCWGSVSKTGGCGEQGISIGRGRAQGRGP